MEKQLAMSGIQAQRFDAIKHEKGYIGCSKSHLECLKNAIGNVLIIEDDLVFTMDKDTLHNKIQSFLDTEKQWDVLILSGVVIKSKFVRRGISRALNVQTTTCYLVNYKYIPTLIENYENSIKELERGGAVSIYALDQHWKVLQEKDNWFVMTPGVGHQVDDHSNIENKPIDYINYFTRPFTVHLMGGLGNQLFQIAFGLSLGWKHGATFHLARQMRNPHSNLDYSWFMRDIPILSVAPHYQIREPSESCLSYLGEINLNPWAIFEFVGYFQNEKYFKDFKDDILRQFTPKVDEQSLREKYPLLDQSYFLHIRRNDFIEHPIHYIDLTQYYNRCVRPDHHYYIFSDDIHWCRANIKFKNIHFVDENEIISLWLMSRCRLGGVCANSSFSWWGAYLNPNPDKLVYYPSKWLNNNFPNDIYPENAIVIPV